MKNITNVTPNEVQSVYSGINGKCCCGCSGKHKYARQYRELAGQHRGYEIHDNEINDGSITRILNILKNHVSSVEQYTPPKKFGRPHYSVVVNNRLYVVYMA